MTIVLIGVDPGIVDTGLVALELDRERKSLTVHSRVWSNVTVRDKNTIRVVPEFLDSIDEEISKYNHTRYTYVEGYRNRGRNPYQDQNMTVLVQAIHKRLTTSKVVDNTGVKKVVKEPLLLLFRAGQLWTQRTHHSDLTSAMRIALKGAIEDKQLNGLIAEFAIDNLENRPWDATIRPTRK